MDYPPQPPIITGIKGKCLRCGQGRLFAGFLRLAPQCDVCGLSYSFADPADRPAFFAMTIMSPIAVGFVLWLDYAYHPAIWVHLVVSLPVLVALCIAPLRSLKGWLVCSQYFHKAEEGRLAPADQPQAEGRQ